MSDLSIPDPPEAPPALVRARELLADVGAREPVWRLVAAAFLAAAAALALAGAVILGPPQVKPAGPGLRPALSKAASFSVEPPGLLRRAA